MLENLSRCVFKIPRGGMHVLQEAANRMYMSDCFNCVENNFVILFKCDGTNYVKSTD